MRKKIICSFLFCLLISTTIVSTIDKVIAKNAYKQEHPENGLHDELDELVEDAIDGGVLKNKIEIRQPSKVEIFLIKAGINLFLKPYIYIAIRYRTCKAWLLRKLKNICKCYQREQKNSVDKQ